MLFIGLFPSIGSLDLISLWPETRSFDFELNTTPSVPRASIIWLALAVNVVRPAARRLHIDRARFAKEWHLGITLGVCMSG